MITVPVRVPFMFLVVHFVCIPSALTIVSRSTLADEAAAGFDDQSNGAESQKDFEKFRDAFQEVDTDTAEDGLGPVFNGTSCVSCHQNPIVGGPSQVSVIRAGHFDPIKNIFVEPPGGSLIFQRAIDASI